MTSIGSSTKSLIRLVSILPASKWDPIFSNDFRRQMRALFHFSQIALRLLLSVSLQSIIFLQSPYHLLPNQLINIDKMPPGLQDYPSPEPVRSLWCTWPAIFTKRRNFSRQAEDEPYIDHLQKLLFSDEQEYDEEEGEEEDEVDKEHISSECDESDNYEEVSPKSGRGVEWDRSQINVLTESWNRGNQPSIVRLFMRGSLGEEDDFAHRDQVEKVARFCEEVQRPDRNLRGQHVALLDDRNCMGIVPSNEAISPSGTCRPYLGPLTAERLRQELSKKVR
jgi:hypothetical protein